MLRPLEQVLQRGCVSASRSNVGGVAVRAVKFENLLSVGHARSRLWPRRRRWLMLQREEDTVPALLWEPGEAYELPALVERPAANGAD